MSRPSSAPREYRPESVLPLVLSGRHGFVTEVEAPTLYLQMCEELEDRLYTIYV
jgi:hypothetical protein